MSMLKVTTKLILTATKVLNFTKKSILIPTKVLNTRIRVLVLYCTETEDDLVEILARTGNKVKPTRENEASNHSSLTGVRNMYRTRTNHSPCAQPREEKRFLLLVKKQPLYNSNIQNTNVRSSGMHKKSMFKITDPSEYSTKSVNHIPVLLRTHPKGILPCNTQRYGKYLLQRT